MIHEHHAQDLLMREIRATLNYFKIEESASQPYKTMVESIEKLDLDLSVHLHLENNILFPKALNLEFNN